MVNIYFFKIKLFQKKSVMISVEKYIINKVKTKGFVIEAKTVECISGAE